MTTAAQINAGLLGVNKDAGVGRSTYAVKVQGDFEERVTMTLKRRVYVSKLEFSEFKGIDNLTLLNDTVDCNPVAYACHKSKKTLQLNTLTLGLPTAMSSKMRTTLDNYPEEDVCMVFTSPKSGMNNLCAVCLQQGVLPTWLTMFTGWRMIIPPKGDLPEVIILEFPEYVKVLGQMYGVE